MNVVITSVGIISSLGYSLKEISKNLKKGQSQKTLSQTKNNHGVPIPTLPIKDFDFNQICGRNKNRRYLTRAGELSVAAAIKCINVTTLTEKQLETCSLYIGAGPFLEPEAAEFDKRQALWLLKHLPNTASSVIASTIRLHGESITIGTACAASLQAIGTAYRAIKHGDTTMAIAGGGDSRLSDEGLNGYLKAGALYSKNDNGDSYSPLINEACGFIPGEGAAFFLLEEKQTAIDRGATILAEIKGFGASTDGYNMTAPNPNGKQPENAIKLALKRANKSLNEIDIISAHGTGTPLNDAMENNLHKRLFQNRKPKIHCWKKELGHLASACGAVELATELAIQNRKDPKTILLENFGFGGQNAALIIETTGNEIE